VIIAILTPALSTIGSYILKGDPIFWITNSPFREILLGITIVSFIVIVLIRKRQIESTGPQAFTLSRHGYQEISSLNYEGVKWRVLAPPRTLWEMTPNKFDLTPKGIRIGPPRCPKCETEIEQTKSFWGGYIWTCPLCGFKKRSGVSYSVIGLRAEKIAQRQMEQHK
jgi:hypothetical protein